MLAFYIIGYGPLSPDYYQVFPVCLLLTCCLYVLPVQPEIQPLLQVYWFQPAEVLALAQ